jgi:hypothetical protein
MNNMKLLNKVAKGLFYISAGVFVVDIIAALLFWNKTLANNIYGPVGFIYIALVAGIVFILATIIMVVTRAEPQPVVKNSYGMIALGLILAFIIGIIILNIQN